MRVDEVSGWADWLQPLSLLYKWEWMGECEALMTNGTALLQPAYLLFSIKSRYYVCVNKNT